ncbi:hypothetical protein [Sphingomonas sanguinis]|uniref:hypothetical protein n=1 Tax=Sphingomonas sanguinis TaxID=33051 RepID=UPI00077BDC26|nr:hypothetical protein [Sphingomonas sanguinis]
MSAAEDPAKGIVVPPTVLAGQAKAQLRLGLAAIGGALVLRKALPEWAVNDQMLDLVAGLIIWGVAAGWSWGKNKLNHARWVAVAANPRVPSDVVTTKGAEMAQAIADDKRGDI